MSARGKERHDAGLGENARRFLHRKIDADAQAFEHVDATGPAARRPISVFRDGHSGARNDERGGRRYVEGLRAVATGSAGVDRLGVDVRRHHGSAPQCLRGSYDFAYRLTLAAQRDEQAGHLRRRRLSIHDLSKRGFEDRSRHLRSVHRRGDRHAQAHAPAPGEQPSRKPPSSVFPIRVRIDSG